jgi:hypothetical protein
MGNKLWLHTDGGDPDEIVISSHGKRSRLKPRTFSLRDGFLPGTTLYFLVEDGVLSAQRLPQTLEGKARRDLMHSADHSAYVYDYSLRKFQASSHGDGNRHTPNALECYKVIGQQVGSQSLTISDAQRRARREKDMVKYPGPGPLGGGDLVKRGVISVRSGGRFSKQEMLLSEVIREAQTPPYSFTTFWCLFCREIVDP